jgi:DMSO/TMAO reductase YedYZ molybdopterin-dependent catalytic subunit
VHDEVMQPSPTPEATGSTGASRPHWWPHFRSPLRSTAVTARLGRALGICFGVCFVTGMLSHYQYHPWSWLPEPAHPVQGYRVTQGLHVATGVATIPLLLVKLWSVYPNLFRWPPIRSIRHALERLSLFVLVSSALVQLTTGFLNTLNWYPWPWSFPSTHRYLGYVVIGSILLHIAMKLPDIKYGLQARLADADVLTEVPWNENPLAHSNAGTVAPPAMPAMDRRGLFVVIGSGIGAVVLTTVGQTVTPLSRIGLLATRQASKGPQGVPVNKTARSARVLTLARADDWLLEVTGPTPFTLTLAGLESMRSVTRHFPLSCVEGWSVGAEWRGIPVTDLVHRAGGSASSRVEVFSLQPNSPYNHSMLMGPQVGAALLATHLNGERLDLDHGYPVRLIAPNRPGVLNTKWLGRMEVT